MPADYSSTAKALALPISPIPSPSPSSQRNGVSRPPWSRRLSNPTRRPYSLTSPQKSYTSQAVSSGRKVYRQLLSAFLKLSPIQRILVVLLLIGINVGGILFLIYNERIFHALAPAAAKWHAIPFGWTILWMITFISSFPPLIGYSTTITIAGFVYGFPNGWFVVASATIAGSLCSFIASRTILSAYVHRLVGEDKRFQALALTLRYDGLKVLCMIRLCPLPYSLSNAAIATFPTVHPLSFALATAIASPKLLIHVFIGSRLATIAENGGKMDAGTKAINYASIAFGAILGAGVGWIIYRKTISRAKELEIEELARAGEEGRSGRRERAYNDLEVDGANGDEDAAVLMMGDDDISLWGNDNDGGDYRDNFTDEEDESNVFASGDVENDDEGRRKPGK
jgi:uncharacterized membrane protein YdjX (TVP38/TMEM64 family)